MTRTGTLAFAHCAALAMLVGWTGATLAQTSEWQPSRSADAPARDGNASRGAASPQRWISPTQSLSKPKTTTTKSNPNRRETQSAARSPNPFVPPADAELIAPTTPANQTLAHKTVGKLPSQNPAAKQQPPAPAITKTSAPRVSTSAAQPGIAKQPQPARTQQAHTAPRRPPATNNRLWDDSWIRPLRQVAFQDGEPEELYAPSGQETEMPMQGETGGPEPQVNGEWIGPADGMPQGGPGCHGECGPDCTCGPMCSDGVCEPSCGCRSCGRNQEDCSVDLAFGLNDPEACQEVRFRVPRAYALMVNGGVHGFKGPYDQDRDSGNFGFQEGFNVGFKVPLSDFGYQFGYQSLQSQLNGDNSGIVDGFSQHFVTAGAFRRSRDGFQGGLVWDNLLDERHTSVTFSQLRAELGFVDCGCHEIGSMVAVHLKDQTLINVQEEQFETFQTTDQYLLYYRMHGQRGGEGRVYAGVTDDADGIVGADFLLPLTNCWSLQPSFTYLIPEEGGGSIGARQEAWNIGINLVWHWKGQARSCHQSPYRPLFNVADNGYMIIDDRP